MSSSQSSSSNSSGMRSTRSNSEPSKSDNKHSSSGSNISISGSKDTGVLNTGIHGGLRKGRDSNGKWGQNFFVCLHFLLCYISTSINGTFFLFQFSFLFFQILFQLSLWPGCFHVRLIIIINFLRSWHFYTGGYWNILFFFFDPLTKISILMAKRLNTDFWELVELTTFQNSLVYM